MIGLDTNVVVRYLVQDDPVQSPIASAIIDALTADDQGFLSIVTVIEVHWVLRRAYKIDAAHCAELIVGLLNARELVVGQEAIVRAALSSVGDGPDFADAVIAELGRTAGCAHTVTFDHRAAASPEFQLLPG